MDFLSQLLRGIAFVPALVNGIEGLFGKSREPKKRRGNVVSAKCLGDGRCCGGTEK